MTRLPIAALVAVSAALLAASSPHAASSPQAEADTSTPAACLQAVRARAAEQLKALTPLTSEGVQKITVERTAMARACALRFDEAVVAEGDLSSLIDLFAEAGRLDRVSAVVARALSSSRLGDADRAAIVLQAIRAGLRMPKNAERNAGLERYVDALDRLPAAFLSQQLSAHQAMNGYYRDDDIDAGIISHSTWIIERAATFTPAERNQYGEGVVSAHVTLAEVWAGHGRTNDAIALLLRGKTEWADVPGAGAGADIDPALARYRLVGTPAAAITAARWLNAPEGTVTMPMTGAATLLVFTAHWCGPCKESYPGIKRLLASYGARGLRVVFATELYGYFGNDGNLTADAEFERDRAYFQQEGLTVPIAVAERPASNTVDGRSVYVPSPNDAAYQVGGTPQIHLIDRTGIIRLIMVGYDDANEPRLAALIEQLLKDP